MLMLVPDVKQEIVENWKRFDQKKLMEIRKKIWHEFEGDAPFFDDSVANYSEWKGDFGELYKGMRNNPDQKHGVVREITLNCSYLVEMCYKNSKMHGLCLTWDADYFVAGIYKDDSLQGHIEWRNDWTEARFDNKEYCLKFFSVDDFKP